MFVTDEDRPRICLAGKNRIAVDALRWLIDSGWKEKLLVCPNRTDNGISNWQPSLTRFANELRVDMITIDQAQEIEDLVFISLEFDQLLRPSAFRTSRLYNIHFSALPAYKGMYTSALPILHGAASSGVTLHEIDHGIDTGEIIAQDTFILPDDWTGRDLYFSYMQHGFRLFRREFHRLVAKQPPASMAQPVKGATYYSKKSIDYANLSIDLCNTADGIIRQLRAFSFREYQTPTVAEMGIGGWAVLPERSAASPGSILERDHNGMVIATIDYNLRLERSTWWDWFSLDTCDDIASLDQRQIDITDARGWTPLIRACYAGRTELCRRLLQAGADPNLSNCNGTTPLMYAFSSPHRNASEPTARMLLEYGADISRKDHFGRTLLDYHPNALLR